jgi:hypothetical protein
MSLGKWRLYAACAPANRPSYAKDYDWFASDPEDKYAARAICQGICPVRKECIQEALLNKELYGIHGGVDDYEIRRAMSVDGVGDPLERDRPPRCPFCLNRKISIAGQKNKQGYRTECNDCGLIWYMAIVPTKMKGKKNA